MAAATYGQLNLEESPQFGSRSVDCFEKLEQIGEGTYSQVYKAREIRTAEFVALKKLRMDNEKEGFPITAIREIKLLKKLQHKNVLKLKEIVTSPGPELDDQGKSDGNKFKGNIYMVFEYMDHDLTGLAGRPGPRFTIPQIKCYMRQLLTGLHYCHVNQVLHRDIKSANLLIDNEGNLKLADFGLARSFSRGHNGNLTNRVVTLWYRPPELLLGATKYGPSIDMWSVGCIFAELLLGKPILRGENETAQLNGIFKLCGSPDESNWPGVSRLPQYNMLKPTTQMKRQLREVFGCFGRYALELLEKMLTLDPLQRISAKDALDAEYFQTDPLPCHPQSLPKHESSHDFQRKKKSRQQQQNEEMAKRQKLQHWPQSGQAHPQHWAGRSHLRSNAQLPLPAGPSHHQHRNPRGPPGGGSGGGPYLPQGRAPSSGVPAAGPQGASGGYGVGPPNYSQSGRYGGSGTFRGPNSTAGNQNQQYGRRQ